MTKNSTCYCTSRETYAKISGLYLAISLVYTSMHPGWAPPPPTSSSQALCCLTSPGWDLDSLAWQIHHIYHTQIYKPIKFWESNMYIKGLAHRNVGLYVNICIILTLGVRKKQPLTAHDAINILAEQLNSALNLWGAFPLPEQVITLSCT